MTYRYQQPTRVAEVLHPRSTPSVGSHRRVVVNPSTRLEDGTIRFPKVVRNRGREGDHEMRKYGHDNEVFYQDEQDAESSVDEKRLSHFERIFYNANALNVRLYQFVYIL